MTRINKNSRWYQGEITAMLTMVGVTVLLITMLLNTAVVVYKNKLTSDTLAQTLPLHRNIPGHGIITINTVSPSNTSGGDNVFIFSGSFKTSQTAQSEHREMIVHQPRQSFIKSVAGGFEKTFLYPNQEKPFTATVQTKDNWQCESATVDFILKDKTDSRAGKVSFDLKHLCLNSPTTTGSGQGSTISPTPSQRKGGSCGAICNLDDLSLFALNTSLSCNQDLECRQLPCRPGQFCPQNRQGRCINPLCPDSQTCDCTDKNSSITPISISVPILTSTITPISTPIITPTPVRSGQDSTTLQPTPKPSCTFSSKVTVKDEAGNIIRKNDMVDPSKWYVMNNKNNKIFFQGESAIININIDQLKFLCTDSSQRSSDLCDDNAVYAKGEKASLTLFTDNLYEIVKGEIIRCGDASNRLDYRCSIQPSSDPATLSAIPVDCNMKVETEWTIRKKPTGSVRFRVELSAGGDLSRNILYNTETFKEDQRKLSGTLTLTGINNDITKSLFFSALNHVVDITFNDIPTGQYRPSINGIYKGLRLEYINQMENNKWKKAPAHVLDSDLYNEAGKKADIVYVTQESTALVRAIYNTDPSAGLVYTSYEACQECQKGYCYGSNNDCDIKPQGKINEWNLYWCTAKFKKNNEGNAIQHPAGFFDSCKGGGLPSGNRGNGCWCTNRADCSKAEGQVEAIEGNNYCRETNDVLCCIGGAKPSAEQLRPNRCCENNEHCSQFGVNWTCTGTNADCASGKKCVEIISAPSVLTRAPAEPTLVRGQPIPSIIPESCRSFAPDLNTLDTAEPTFEMCPPLIPGQLYAGGCGGMGGMFFNCPTTSRPVFKWIKRQGVAGDFEFQYCQEDSNCPRTVIGPVNCATGEETFGSCGGPLSEGGKCDSFFRPRFVCQQAVKDGKLVNRFFPEKRRGLECGNNIPGECKLYIFSSLIAPQNEKKSCEEELKRCDTDPSVRCRNLPMECIGYFFKPYSSDVVRTILSICGNSCVPCLCSIIPQCRIGLALVVVSGLLDYEEGGLKQVVQKQGGELLLEKSAANFTPEIFKRMLEKKVIGNAELDKALYMLRDLSDTELASLVRKLAHKFDCIKCAQTALEHNRAQINQQVSYVDEVLSSATLGLSINAASAGKKPVAITMRLCFTPDNCQEKTQAIDSANIASKVGVIFNNPNLQEESGSNKRYLLNCEITFDDGSKDSCPRNIPVDTMFFNNISVETGKNKDIFFSKTPTAADADLNIDGEVNTVDYALLLQSYDDSSLKGDVNSDGLVNAIDVSAIIELLGKKIE